MKWTKRLDNLVGAIAFPRKFNLTYESDTKAIGIINDRSVEVIRTRQNIFAVKVGNIPSIILTSETDVNNFLAIVAGYDH